MQQRCREVAPTADGRFELPPPHAKLGKGRGKGELSRQIEIHLEVGTARCAVLCDEPEL